MGGASGAASARAGGLLAGDRGGESKLGIPKEMESMWQRWLTMVDHTPTTQTGNHLRDRQAACWLCNRG